MNRLCRGMSLRWSEELRSLVDFLPLIVASVLIAVLATAAGPASTSCLFQSPVGPATPISPMGSVPAESPVVPSPIPPQETTVSATPTVPVLTAVPVAPDFVPWVVGLAAIVVVVVAVLFWRRGRGGGVTIS